MTDDLEVVARYIETSGPCTLIQALDALKIPNDVRGRYSYRMSVWSTRYGRITFRDGKWSRVIVDNSRRYIPPNRPLVAWNPLKNIPRTGSMDFRDIPSRTA